MKRYIYPMVLFTDENELYTALYPDLNLLASGFSIEDVYARANDYLGFYITSALKYDAQVAKMSTYSEIQASKFTVSSEAKWKKNIQTLDYNAMDLINRTVVYEYELKDNSNTRDIRKKTIGLVVDYETPEEIIIETEILDDREYGEGEEFIPGKVKQIDKGVDLYAMSSLAWKALQEKDAEIKDLQTRVGHLEALVKQLLEAKN